ncbi:MAG TPA: hypothetical protein VGJ73_14920, partial [Verrucomicrobiae bacterium]
MNKENQISRVFHYVVAMCICLLSVSSRADSTNDAWNFPSTDLPHNLAVQADQAQQLLNIFAPPSPGLSNVLAGRVTQFADFLKRITNAAAPLGKTLTNLTAEEFVELASNEIQAVDNRRNTAKVLYDVAKIIPLSLDSGKLDQNSSDATQWLNQSESRALMQLALVADASAQAIANSNGMISPQDRYFLLMGLTNVLGSGGTAAIQQEQAALPDNLRNSVDSIIQKFEDGNLPFPELTNFADAYYQTVSARFIHMARSPALNASLVQLLNAATNRIDKAALANLQTDWAEEVDKTLNATNGDILQPRSPQSDTELFDDYVSSLEERQFLFRLMFEDLGVVQTNDFAFQTTISLEPEKLKDMLERLYDKKIKREI